MSDVKQEIVFHETMTANKRSASAYLRKNVLKALTPGLYPARDFYQSAPFSLESGHDIENILGSDRDGYDIKVITSSGSTTNFYDLGSTIQSNDPTTHSAYRAAAFGNDGVYAAFLDGTVHRVNHDDFNTPEVGDYGSSWDIELGAYDGLNYWWLGPSAIYSQLPEADPIQRFNSVIPGDIKGADFYNNYMVIFTQVGRNLVVNFWDKLDNSLFYKRITIKNATFIAGGVVDGSLMLIYAVGTSGNPKELQGELKITRFDGENFLKLNTIKCSADVETIDGSSTRQISYDTGSEILLFAVTDNISTHNEELYQNYIYKVRSNGAIEVQEKPRTTGVSQDRASIVRVFYDFNLYTVNSPWKIYINQTGEETFEEYNTYRSTEYITEFFGNPYGFHRLDALNIAFERMYQVAEPEDGPFPGEDGVLNYEDVDDTSLTLLWSKGTDPVTPQEDLEYKVYRSTSNNIGTVADAIANGTMVQDWTADVASAPVTGLSANTSYYFNVLIRDDDGNMAAYSTLNVTTTPVVTAWKSPTTNASVVIGAFPIDPWTNPSNAYSANDSFATAAQGDQKFQSYYTFNQAVPVGATVLGIQVRVKGKNTSNPGGGSPKIGVGMTKAAASPTDLVNQTGSAQTATLSTSNEYYLLGGPSSLWGSTWTPAELNAAAFGLLVSGNTSSSPATTDYAIDHIEVRVFYTP